LHGLLPNERANPTALGLPIAIFIKTPSVGRTHSIGIALQCSVGEMMRSGPFPPVPSITRISRPLMIRRKRGNNVSHPRSATAGMIESLQDVQFLLIRYFDRRNEHGQSMLLYLLSHNPANAGLTYRPKPYLVSLRRKSPAQTPKTTRSIIAILWLSKIDAGSSKIGGEMARLVLIATS